ncbi:MAG: DUF3363 domain-containing protein [Alphaproteobacteria bacterium]|nr:DUF3363 domain-containing protein [Alphaproteobacteria bacterium]
MERAGRALAAENGCEWHAPIPGNYVSGRLTGSTMIGSQRFAIMNTVGDDGKFGLSLVPWKKELQHELGNYINGVAMPGGGIEWSLGRGRGLGR